MKRCFLCGADATLVLRWRPVSFAYIEEVFDTLLFPLLSSRLPEWFKLLICEALSLPFKPMEIASRRREIPICERCRLSLPIRVCRWWRADLLDRSTKRGVTPF